MNSIFKILGILLLFMLLKAEKCSDQSENAVLETQVNNMRKEIKLQFDAGFLSEASLNEHEKAAIRKLSDFADYLRILADSSLPQTYREKTGELILNLFLSDTVHVKMVTGRDEKSHEFRIGQLIQSALKNELLISRIVYDSVQIIRNFTRSGPDSYTAILGFVERTEKNRNGINTETIIPGKIHACINRETRIFDSDTLSVWVLRLGEME